MIKKVLIKNYILIEELLVEFDEGLNVITGETGAGKSIVINAIDLVFAPRVSKEVIKTGTEKASIELILDVSKKDLTTIFDEFGIDNLGEELVITKEISLNSVRTKVNGSLANQELIKVLKEKFLDIHSQHQTYSFMQPKFHISLLDSYAKDAYGKDLDGYKSLYVDYLQLQKQLEAAKSSANATESQIDFLMFQINEIEEAQIEDKNEDEALKNELSVLENAEKLKELTGAACWALSDDDGSISNALSTIKMNISKASRMDENLADVEERLINLNDELVEISRDLRHYSQNVENDTEKLNVVQERIFVLDKLKRKYGGSLSEVLSTYQTLKNEYAKIEFSTKNVDELESEIEKTRRNLVSMAEKISDKRRDFAQVLSSLVEDKLEKLELPKSRFQISVEKTDLNSNGADNVEFLISTNVSEGLKPLAKVASGGEVSRVMLAIKSIFAHSDEIDTVIFDEIDTGISGKASQSVADEIAELANYHQIILITHQPIIASKAEKHFYVKKSQGDSTNVEFYALEGENRIKALAELAGGEINEQSVEFARSLVDSVSK